MKKTFCDLIKGIITSSVAAIASIHGADAAPVVKFNDSSEDALKEESNSVKKDLSYKLMLNINSDDEYYLSGHRSHSSHRRHSSHRSGSSHYSSHYSSSSTTRSTSTTSTSRTTSTSSKKSSTSNTASTSLGIFSYGSRTMIKDLFGSDVKTASDHLVKLGYLKSSQITKNASGHVQFNEDMVEATKLYEKDKGITEDGTINKETATALASDALNYRELGSRDLTLGMSGTDVTEMRNLLIDKGYIEGSAQGKYESSSFDTHLLDALKAFLDDIGLEWENKVDSQIVRFLKKNYDD